MMPDLGGLISFLMCCVVVAAVLGVGVGALLVWIF
jgi:hypothetical protein